MMAPTAIKHTQIYYEDLVGRVLQERYELRRFLKAGGSSGVYEAADRKMRRSVAVKILPEVDRVMSGRFRREADVLSQLNHPNTVAVYDFGCTEDGFLYMILEYLDGKLLKDSLRRARSFHPARAVRIFSQVCRALSEAHSHGIVHRDIKPSNIYLVHRDGNPEFVKLLDFGVAKVLKANPDAEEVDVTKIGRIIGTPRYMPPEQITSESVDTRADIYSAGVLLYEMICGTVPFQDPSLGGLLMMHLKRDPPPFSEYDVPHSGKTPSGVQDAVMKALAKRPEERFQGIEDFRDSVESAMGTSSGKATMALDPIVVEAWEELEMPPPVPDHVALEEEDEGIVFDDVPSAVDGDRSPMGEAPPIAARPTVIQALGGEGHSRVVLAAVLGTAVVALVAAFWLMLGRSPEVSPGGESSPPHSEGAAEEGLSRKPGKAAKESEDSTPLEVPARKAIEASGDAKEKGSAIMEAESSPAVVCSETNSEEKAAAEKAAAEKAAAEKAAAEKAAAEKAAAEKAAAKKAAAKKAAAKKAAAKKAAAKKKEEKERTPVIELVD
jgi:serine/threonine-protein kinase